MDESATIGSTLADAARRAPSREVLVCGGERITYADLAERSSLLAGGLRAAGVAAGDRVGVIGPNGVPWAAAFFGAARVGTVIPVSPRQRPDEAAAMLEHARATALVACGGEREPGLARAIGERMPELRVADADALAATGGEGDDRARPEDLAIVQYTSGTTARPKGVLLTHAQVVRNAAALGERLDVRAGDRYGSAMPFYHVGGSVLTLLLSAARAATAVTIPRFEAGEMLAALEGEACTHFFGIETHCVMLLERPELTKRPASLRVAFVGGRREVLEGVRARLCPVIVNRYGLTESSGNTCSTEVSDPPEVALATMGRPLPGLALRVVDGEIRVRGWGVTRGYLDDPEATRAAFDDEGWFRTGDAGEIGADGRLMFRGRIRDALRVGGENVAAAEIEALIGSHPAVAQVAVVPVADARLGEVPVAFVELRAGATASEDEIVGFCRARVAGYKVPRRVHFVSPDAWPLTGSGKIRKRALAERAATA